ncbi:MAG: sulfate ABC transporter substrate-binding protein [Solirubrobacteraceae bacterium]|nr:sulfate ABC transporter substrate-binding protein [Patulibacter sp.]
MRIRSLTSAVAAVATAAGLAACGGASDSTSDSGSSSSSGAKTNLSLVAYSVPKPGFDKVIPAFQKTAAGKNVTFSQSYGPSGDQSRKVVAGLSTDIVNFSVEPDMTRLVKAGIVDANWNQDQNKGLAFTSIVTIVVKKGNPKGIHDWDDLLKPGVEVVTPNPFSSGSAKWNLLAPYAAKSDGGKNPQAGLSYLSSLIKNHVKVQPKSGSEASETFLQGQGDALITYENEALFLEGQGDPVEHVTPPQTFKIENPIAVTKNTKHADAANAFKEFAYSTEGQTLWAQAGFRPVDQQVFSKFASKFPAPQKLWTIDDLGGWAKVDPALFDPDNGSVAKIYNAATS